MAKIAVIGSHSFSGFHFVDHCLQKGHEVLGVSRSATPEKPFLPYLWNDNPSLKHQFHQGRLPEDIESIGNALKCFKPEYVVNFAALGMVAESWQFPGDYYKTNVLGNVVLHEVLRKLPSLAKYVHISTPEVYGHTKGYINETASLNPTTPYAASRAACDMHLNTFRQQYGFPVVWTRAANVFGPGQQLYRIVPRTLLAGYFGEKLQLHGGGSSVRSFIHIRDVCEATLKIAQEADPGDIFHLSTLETVSIRALVQRICELSGWDFENIVELAPERPGKDSAYLLDSSYAREKLQWVDRLSLDQGILETKKWIEENLEFFEHLSFNYEHKN